MLIWGMVIRGCGLIVPEAILEKLEPMSLSLGT